MANKNAKGFSGEEARAAERRLANALDNKKDADPPHTVLPEDAPDFANWSEEQVGFAPYWQPAPGACFYGAVIARDDRSPNFVRFLILAGMSTQCLRGAADDAETVTVEKGKCFTVSVYSQLAPKLEEWLDTPFPVYVRAEVLRKTQTSNDFDMWNWRLTMSPETRAQLDEYRRRKRALNGGPGADLLPPGVKPAAFLQPKTPDALSE